MTLDEAVSLARDVIDKYGADADKPSVHLAKAVLDGAHERDSLRTRQTEFEKELVAYERRIPELCADCLSQVERMRAVYEAAAKVSQLRERQRRLSDIDYDQLDGQIGEALDDLDRTLTPSKGVGNE